MKFNIDHDYHIHSRLSPCSNDPMQNAENIFQYAKGNGFREICVADHFWDRSVEGAISDYARLDYELLSAILPLPQSETVKFRFGCETELKKDMTLGISEKTFDKFDFIIVPTTHLHFTGFTVEKEDSSIERRAELYAERLDKVLDMPLPFEKVGIAHLTCPLMAYNYASDFDEHIRILDTVSDSTYRELFTKLARKGAGFELNFNISAYSGSQLERILRPYRLAKECECKFYFGSDAHHPADLVGARSNFEKIAEALCLDESDRFRF